MFFSIFQRSITETNIGGQQGESDRTFRGPVIRLCRSRFNRVESFTSFRCVGPADSHVQHIDVVRITRGGVRTVLF